MATQTRELQRRITSEPFKVRTNADGTVGVRGYASVFNQEAHGEVIMPSAFNRTLAQRDDIRLLVNHDGVPLARTKSGTLDVGVDDHGLWFDAPSLDPTNPRVQELVSAMNRNDIDQCSFAGYFTDVHRDNGVDQVREVKATDVSIVTYPWYEGTEASVTGDRQADLAVQMLRDRPPEVQARAIGSLDSSNKAPRSEGPTEAEQRFADMYGDDVRQSLRTALRDRFNPSSQQWVWVRDFTDVEVVFELDGYPESGCFRLAYTMNERAVSLASDQPTKVVTQTMYVPERSAPEGPAADESTTRTHTIAEARALLGI